MGTVIRRILAVLGVTLAAVIVAFFAAVTVICKGPSTQARGLFVSTVMETSAAKFLAKLYFSEAEIDAIQQQNAVIEVDLVTDDTAIAPEEPEDSQPEIAVEDVSGGTFKGKMMIVRDPKRCMWAPPVPTTGRRAKSWRIWCRAMGLWQALTPAALKMKRGWATAAPPSALSSAAGSWCLAPAPPPPR